MQFEIQWITPLYGFGANCCQIGVTESARDILGKMAKELLETDGLIAIYIPEGTPNIYNPEATRGRIVGAARLIKMPRRKTIEDYFCDDYDGSRRWPIGWPCEAVYAPETAECPVLREHVEHLFGARSFAGYVSRFQRGPFSLEDQMRQRLNSDFSQFTPLI